MLNTATISEVSDPVLTVPQEKKHVILYVDDEDHNLRVFRSAFRRYYSVIVHNNPMEALETIKEGNIDVLITDQRMPGMTGTQMIEAFRDEFPDLISILLTGYSDIDAVTDAINKCDIHRYVAKPYDITDLKSTIDNAIKMESLKKDKESLLDRMNANNKELEVTVHRRTEELSNTHQRLVDSLTYAENIQKSILTDPSELEGVFEDSFIFYQPLDIVSGDFYMLRKIGERAIIGSFDCTGHGVPGAMLSMLGNAAIDNALLSNIIRPSELMTTVNNKIHNQLKVSQRSNDGMDGGFLLYNRESNKISFSGAHSDVILFRNGEMERVRGNRVSVGDRFMDVDQTFDQYNEDALGVTEIYMYSDGYRDQFNENDQKFKTSRFHALLNRIHKLDFKQQHQILENEFKKWKGNADQTDDVMVLGFRLK